MYLLFQLNNTVFINVGPVSKKTLLPHDKGQSAKAA